MRIIYFALSILLFFVTTANAARQNAFSRKESTYEAKLSREHTGSLSANIGVQLPTLSKVDLAPAIGLTYLHRIAGQWRLGLSVTHSTHHRRIDDGKEMITPVLIEGQHLFNQWLYASGQLGVTMHGSDDAPTNVLPTLGGRGGFVFYKQENWALAVENSITLAIGSDTFIAFQIPIAMTYRF